MVVSRAEIDRLRTEADTIFTRIETVQSALDDARTQAGDHWEERELRVTLETPTGKPIDVVLDLDCSAAENAQRRYERAGELETELQRREAIAGELAAIPPDPRAFLVVWYLDEHGPDGTRSMAGALDADHATIADLCDHLETNAIVQWRERAGEPSVYRLTDEGSAIREQLDTEDGKRNFCGGSKRHERSRPASRVAAPTTHS